MEKSKAGFMKNHLRAVVCCVLVIVIIILGLSAYSFIKYKSLNFFRTFYARSVIEDKIYYELSEDYYMIRYDSDIDTAMYDFSANVGATDFFRFDTDGGVSFYQMSFDGKKRIASIDSDSVNSSGYLLITIKDAAESK